MQIGRKTCTLLLICAFICVLPTGGQSTQSSQAGADKTTQTPAKLTPEQIEAVKKQNEKAAQMNVLIGKLQVAMDAKNWKDAVPLLQELIPMDPTRWDFLAALGSAQLYLGNYDDAIKAFEQGIAAAEKSKPPDPKEPSADTAKRKAGIAQMLTNEGNAYLKLNKNGEAIAAYTKAASVDSNPAIAYFNLCATEYNMGEIEAAIGACEKAIQADPKRADAYFVKGSAMFGNGKLDANNKYVLPPGTVEALKKYLELAPDGAHAADVKAMLEAAGVKQ